MMGTRSCGAVLAGVMLMVAGAALGQTQPKPAGGALPTGHPGAAEPGGGMGHGNVELPKVGGLRVLVTQGTEGGPAIGKEPATLQLLSGGEIIKTIETTLDEKGVLEVKDLPLEPAFVPVVTVRHGGGPQQLVGVRMSKYQPGVELEMKVYEVTEEKPAWNITMRHVTAQVEVVGESKEIKGLRVVEMMIGNNPADKAWLGTLDASKQRQTMAIALPEGSSDVLLGKGMLEAGAKVQGGVLVRPGTMPPGVNQYDLGYLLPVKEGKATLKFVMPADTTLFAISLPPESKVEKAEGVEVSTSMHGGGNTGILMYRAKGLKSGVVATIELSGLKPPKPLLPDMPLGGTMPATEPASAPASGPAGNGGKPAGHP